MISEQPRHPEADGPVLLKLSGLYKWHSYGQHAWGRANMTFYDAFLNSRDENTDPSFGASLLISL